MGVKNYTFSGIRIEAMQINPPMSEDDSNELSKWIGEHNVTVTVETSYDIGTAILVESEGAGFSPLEYSFYMYPGEWLAYDGDIFFHIADDVFRKHYREITGKKVTDRDDAVVYATGGIGPLFQPIHTPATETDKPRGGATMRASYLDEMDTAGKAHQPFVDAIRKVQGKTKADTCPYPRPKTVTGGKKTQIFTQLANAAESKLQDMETNSETYDRHMGLLDQDGHADHCTYCKDTTRNTVPPAFNKALADAVDKELADMARRRGSSHFHMDSDGKFTARRLSEELKRDWAPNTHTIKVTPRKRTDEWRPSLETLAMYYNDFTPKAKPTPKKKHTENKDAKKAYDSIHDYLNIIKDLADTDIYDIPAIRGLADRAKSELDHLHLNLKGPNA